MPSGRAKVSSSQDYYLQLLLKIFYIVPKDLILDVKLGGVELTLNRILSSIRTVRSKGGLDGGQLRFQPGISDF